MRLPRSTTAVTADDRAAWRRDGYLVVPDAVPVEVCRRLMARAAEIVADAAEDPVSVFSTHEQTRTSDEWFLSSSLHVIDDADAYHADAWRQRPPDLALRGF